MISNDWPESESFWRQKFGQYFEAISFHYNGSEIEKISLGSNSSTKLHLHQHISKLFEVFLQVV